MSVQSAARIGGAAVTPGALGTPGCAHEPPWWEVDADAGSIARHLSECALITVPITSWVNYTAGLRTPGEPPLLYPECPDVPESGTLRSELAASLAPPDLGVWAGEQDHIPFAGLDIEVDMDLSFAITARYAVPMWLRGLEYYDEDACSVPTEVLLSWDPASYWIDEMAGELPWDCAADGAIFGGLDPGPTTAWSVEVAMIPPTLVATRGKVRGGFPSLAWLLDPAPVPVSLVAPWWVPFPPEELPEGMVGDALGSVGMASDLLAEVAVTQELPRLARETLEVWGGLLAHEPGPVEGQPDGMPMTTTALLLSQSDAADLAPLVLALRTGNSIDADCPDLTPVTDPTITAVCGDYLQGGAADEGPANPDVFVGSHHFLLERIGIYEAGLPTRAAAVRAVLAGACGTLGQPGAGSCADHVVISLAGEQAAGSDGAIWLFRPDPGLAATWQPGRLP